MFAKTLLAALAVTVSTAVPASEAGDVDFAPGGTLSRAEVREALNAARAANVLPAVGEAGDSDHRFLARLDFQRERAAEQLARAQEEELQRQALREAEIALAIATSDYVELHRLGALHQELGPVAGIEVIPAATAGTPDEIVIVTLAGGSPAQLERRADAVRRQLVAMGLDPDQVFVEMAQS